MVGDLIQALSATTAGAAPRRTVLCVFGDHVPILSSVYDAWGYPDGLTDFMVWRNWDSPNNERHHVQPEGTALAGGSMGSGPVALHELGHLVIQAAGLRAASGAVGLGVGTSEGAGHG